MTLLTDTLCTRCGLCCDGSLFADVDLLGEAEVTRLEILGGRIDDEGGGPAVMLQPCAALCGTRCGIYAHRPRSCRSFECRLLRDARRGAVSVERAADLIAATLVQIGRAKSLLARLGPDDPSLPLEERCQEALASTTGGRQAARARAELEVSMSEVRRSIRKSFLGGRPRRARDRG